MGLAGAAWHLDIRLGVDRVALADQPVQDLARIALIWGECRTRYGADGPFLFGDWSLADVFYAPVVSRCRTYDVRLTGAAADYANAVWEHPDVREWRAGAEAEDWVEPEFDL